MSHLRTIARFCGLALVLVAWGCSGSDDSATDQPAASQLASPEGLFSTFEVASPNFQERVRPRTRFPKENTCLGENQSPPLDWTAPPKSTQSFALVAEDINHSTGIWVHWVLYNIPPDATGLPSSIPTSTDVLPDGTVQGTNDFRAIGYYGPCPAPALLEYWKVGTEPPHQYVFKLYALDDKIGLAPGATKAELLNAMDGHVLSQTETMGKFSAPPQVAETLTQVARKTIIPGQPTPTWPP